VLLRRYAISSEEPLEKWQDGSWAFDGGLNNHSGAAKRRMRGMRVARIA
jgi:stearoyl-CoA desaturase (delta-9 desaturase)